MVEKKANDNGKLSNYLQNQGLNILIIGKMLTEITNGKICKYQKWKWDPCQHNCTEIRHAYAFILFFLSFFRFTSPVRQRNGVEYLDTSA